MPDPSLALTVSRLSPTPLLRALDSLSRLAEAAGSSLADTSPSSVLEAAARRSGSRDWGDPRFLEPMSRVLGELAGPRYTTFGRVFCRQVAIRAVQNRIAIERHVRAHPAILDVPIQRPVFVLGFPRSGTTLLQNLLAQEPDSRALRFWELTNPTPLHVDPARDIAIRRARASRDLRLATLVAPEMARVHDISADSAEECWPLMGNTFAVLNFDLADDARAFGDWLLGTDLTWAWHEYRRMLQILLHREPASTVVLKCPEHLWFLDTLLAVFPDACVVWAHRDPAAAIASYSSMVTMSRRAMLRTVDPEAIGAHITRRFDQGLQRAMAARATADPSRFFDVSYEALIADPADQVRQIRAHFDLPSTDAGRAAVSRWLERPRDDGPGRHVYSARRYGISPQQVTRRLQPYLARHAVPVAPAPRRALLVHPEFPITYWGFQYALPMSRRKASLPPLGLLSLAALLPTDWELALVDLNIEALTDEAIAAADVVLVGGMRVQAPSMRDVIRRARAAGVRVVVGGPAPTSDPALFAAADVVFRGEAEGRIDALIAAIDADGHVEVMQSAIYPRAETIPVPRFDLLHLPAYGALSLQTSRGCPFTCEFCDIIELFGRKPRVKTPEQVVAELEAIRAVGYEGTVFVVDDNFIGHRRKTAALLDAITAWQARFGHPFDLQTEASVNLADDEVLTRGMVEAGFTAVFLGIETTSPEALAEAGKVQNTRRPLSEAVAILTRAGLEVMGGFIVGFDSDREEVFALQREFIEGSPIPLAMIGPLMALPSTALWRRLDREGRLRNAGSGAEGDQFGRPNFEPAMDEEQLLRGYSALLASLYTADAWYDRCEAFLALAPPVPGLRAPHPRDLIDFVRISWAVGVLSPRRWRYWRLLGRALWTRPAGFSWAVIRGMVGEHMIRYTAEHVLPRLDQSLESIAQERRALNAPRARATGA